MSNGLRGAREIGAAGAEQAALDISNAETLDSMDAAISGIKDWQKKRQKEMMKLKKQLLEEEQNDASARLVSPQQVSYETPSTLFVTGGNQEADVSRDDILGRAQYKVDLPGENYDPIADAMERKLRKELGELQEKRKKQLYEQKNDESSKCDDEAFARACVRRNMAKYGLSADQLNELTSEDSQSSQDLAKVEASVRQLRVSMFANSITAQCKSGINEDEVEKEAGKNGVVGCNKLLDGLDDYTRQLDETLFKLNALSEISATEKEE